MRDPATGNVIGITEKPEKPPLDLLIADISLVLDSAKNFIPDWEDFDVELLPTIPPFVWHYSKDNSFGFEGTNVRLDLSKVEGVPQVLGRPGYTEEWIGLFIGELHMFGLDQVCPVFPPVVALTEWIIGFNDGGVSGQRAGRMAYGIARRHLGRPERSMHRPTMINASVPATDVSAPRPWPPEQAR